jgi:hypothetical protein
MAIKTLKQNDKIKSMKERVRWAIGYICDNYNMTNEKIGKEMGCATSTINSYRRMITVPGMDFLTYMQKYNFSLEWFTSGRGEPFTEEHEGFPDVFELVKTPLPETIDHNSHRYNSLPQKMKLSDAIFMCTLVLESGTTYATALYFCIQHFHRAVETERSSRNCQDNSNSLQKEFEEMKNRLESVEKENRNLHMDIQKLKENNGSF